MGRFANITGVVLLMVALWSSMTMWPTRKTSPATGTSNVAIGFSFAPNYGTVACRHADGTFENIARVNGSPRYLAVMQRLSLQTSTHPSPPYSTVEDMWHDAPRRLLRKSRKAIGLVASSDVAVLSGLLKELRQKAEGHIGPRVDTAVISYPRLAALYNEDIVDAAAYLGIVSLRGYHLYQPREMVAAYAGHGMGLCENYEDEEQCNDEGKALPTNEVLSIQCTDTAILLHAQGMRDAIDLADNDDTALADFEYDKDSPVKLVESINSILEERYRYLKRPAEMTVILSGGKAASPGLKDLVSNTIKDFGPSACMITDEPEYIAARGAAELAWRSSFSTMDQDTSL